MDIIRRHAQLAPEGAELIAALKDSGLTRTEIADVLDISAQRASMLSAIGEALTAQDLKLAADLKYSVDRLHEISGINKRLKNPDVDVAKLRTDLIRDCAQMKHRDLRAYVRELLQELNDGYIPIRAWYLRYSAVADNDGMKYLIAKMPAEHVDRLRTTLTPQARALAGSGQAVSEAEGHAMALFARVVEGHAGTYEHIEAGENPANPKDLRHRPCFLIPIKDTHFLENGEIANSDGAIIDMRELVDATVHEYGYAVTCYNDKDGVPRPQQAFEIKRLADADDRFLTIISHLICQHADCDVPAVRCEIHHIQAFARGGSTTLENLCPLCRQHNLENDDDPDRPKHGRVIKDRTTGLTWYKDYKGRIRRNQAKIQEYNGLAAASRMLS